MPELHSKHSASNFEANMLCPGRPVMCNGLPDRGSKYADEGTAAHQVLQWAIDDNKPAAAYIGRRVPVGLATVEATADMAGHVQTAIDAIREIVGDGMILSEQRVNYSSYLGVPSDEAWGTSDIVAVRGDELLIMDLKYGMGVEVSAEDNPQMKLYGLGALVAMNDTLGPFETVRMVILQPRIKSAPSEWSISVADLEAWGTGPARSAVLVRQAAERAYLGAPDTPIMDDKEWDKHFLHPNEKSCKFCKAKATCPALRAEAFSVVTTFAEDVGADFDMVTAGSLPVPNAEDDAAALASVMSKADLIDDWLKSIRAEVERRLLAGSAVPGFKVVQGKRGNRAWSDPAEAEKLLRDTFRLKIEEAFELKLISPTSAEKLHKSGAIGPRQWPKAVALITQSEGKPSVAPISDPRPALAMTPPADDFETLPSAAADFA